jgi:ribosome-associated toxin RatA of RatAB toxin-antitoxin module
MFRNTGSFASKAGGRSGARRLFVLFIIVVSGLMQPAPLRATDRELQPYVFVREERGVYSTTVRFQVPQPSTVVLAVLTDYEDIPRFMPGIDTSVVLERADGRAVVQQEAISRMMVFSKRVHLVLEISEGADTLRFYDRCGRSFSRYEGVWRVSGQNGMTEILYELVARPSFDVPEFVLKRMLKRNSEEMIEQLRREIAARSVRGSSGRDR